MGKKETSSWLNGVKREFKSLAKDNDKISGRQKM